MSGTVGIVGLGLIGGSLAKAVKSKTDNKVLGCDAIKEVIMSAVADGAIDGELTADTLCECQLIIIALYAQDVISYCKENFRHMNPGTVVVDCAGVKTRVCEELPDLAKSCGLKFVGGHPMAGIERSGYTNSFAGLFDGASMILCEDNETLRDFFLSIGFGKIKIAPAREHDEVIAYTSQLVHLVSSAYIHGKTMKRRYGFSAGSFKDLTRVARLNDDMWTKLFFENRDNLLRETDEFLTSVQKYRDALAQEDFKVMRELLRTGTELKLADEAEEQRWNGGVK